MKAAWVEMRNIPPFLEDQSTTLLEAIGPVMFQALEKRSELQHAIIRACVMVDILKPLPTAVGIKTPWWKTYFQPVVFTRIPDHCYQCLKKGHIAKQCPTRRRVASGNQPESMHVPVNGVDEDAVRNPIHNEPTVAPVTAAQDGFVPVASRRRSKQPQTATTSGVLQDRGVNQFSILDEVMETVNEGGSLGSSILAIPGGGGGGGGERLPTYGMGLKVRCLVLRPDKTIPPRENENPFSSWHSVLEPTRREVQRKVVFEWQTEMAEWAGRGPKKKEVSSSRSQGFKARTQLGVRPAAGVVVDKRRALGSLDHNGCRHADSHELFTSGHVDGQY
ncbi:hypothetical protein R1sor_000451 [Riccia sorocarpa]|uniref:CCHC-type domain-containing protein n=1 Tax=Riccia sorocarpa TaxID=122646 RepID=A0ABD3GZ49_9MARC